MYNQLLPLMQMPEAYQPNIHPFWDDDHICGRRTVYPRKRYSGRPAGKNQINSEPRAVVWPPAV